MGRIRHLTRRHPRQTSIRLVRILDDALQPLRRLPPLLPPRRNLSIPIIRPPHPLSPRPNPPKPTLRHQFLEESRLRPPPHLHPPIHPVPPRPPTLRPSPRLPPPLHKIRLGILRPSRNLLFRARRNPPKRGAVVERDEHGSPVYGPV